MLYLNLAAPDDHGEDMLTDYHERSTVFLIESTRRSNPP